VSGFAFDANILIDSLNGLEAAKAEIERATDLSGRAWISRMVWVEVLSKETPSGLKAAEFFLSGFGMDEIDRETAERAAALRRQRPKLRSPDALILASAQVHNRILITRNTKDFPAEMPGIRVPYLL
jgi:predicted nucleic acid-binding protein